MTFFLFWATAQTFQFFQHGLEKEAYICQSVHEVFQSWYQHIASHSGSCENYSLLLLSSDSSGNLIFGGTSQNAGCFCANVWNKCKSASPFQFGICLFSQLSNFRIVLFLQIVELFAKQLEKAFKKYLKKRF